MTFNEKNISEMIESATNVIIIHPILFFTSLVVIYLLYSIFSKNSVRIGGKHQETEGDGDLTMDSYINIPNKKKIKKRK